VAKLSLHIHAGLPVVGGGQGHSGHVPVQSSISHLSFVALVLRRYCALVLGEPGARQKAIAVKVCTLAAAHRRHHMSALLRLLSAGEASATGSSWTSFAASCMLNVAPCLEMTCRQATTEL
jgi:hypothetical protein